MSERSPSPSHSEFSASDWLRENVGASIKAQANIEEYTQIDVFVIERGRPVRRGTAWDLDTAVGRAVGAVT